MSKKYPLVPALRKMATVAAISVLFLPLAARSETREGAIELSPFAGYNFFETRQNLDDDIIYGGRIGYNIKNYLTLEGAVEFVNTNVDDDSLAFTEEGQFTSPIDEVNIALYHLDLLYNFTPEERFNPFIAVGYGAANYSPKINNKNMSVINYGLGAKYWLGDSLAVRVDLRDNLIYDERIHNLEATVGVVLAFGGTKSRAAEPVARKEYKPEPKPEPIPVAKPEPVPPPAPKPVPVPVVVEKAPVKAPAPPPPPPVVKPIPKVVILATEPKIEEKVKVAIVEPKVVILAFEDIHFDFDQSTLKPEAQIILKRNIQLLKDNPKAKIRVAGYTSASGTEEYNQQLSERRATAVKDYLVKEGVVSSDRLTKIGFGENRPEMYEGAPADLYSEAAKANMRVLFEIVVE